MHHFAVCEIKAKGCLFLRCRCASIRGAGGGDQAASLLEGLAVGARRDDRLGTGVDDRGDALDLLDVFGVKNETSP